MMMQTQQQYAPSKTVKLFFNQVQTAYLKGDEQKLSQLFKQFYNDPAYNSNADRWKVSLSFNNYPNSLIDTIFIKMLETMKAYIIQKLKKGIHYAFKIHLDVLTLILKILDQIKDQSFFWIFKPLRQIIRSTKKIFFTALKKDQETGGQVSVKKDNLIIKLQQIKTKRTLNDLVKKSILPLIDNMQVSIMMSYHSYDQIWRILDNTKPYGDHGPQTVNNYYFQKAKTAMIYERFKDAQQYFERIVIKTRGQKRLVLKYLIPCKMFLGKTFTPNPNNSQQNFPQYNPIIKALSQAKFSDYTNAIQKYQKVWIKRGIYLLMDKLRVILWRNLLKKVHRILGDDKVDIQKIHKAVTLSGGQQRIQQCICVISNLIYEGNIKGYIFQNQEQKVLVLKKGGEGFPSLSK